jgi:hypothetical protein
MKAKTVRDGHAFEASVIPAKAGIHSASLRECAVDRLDSRFRGNDCTFELPTLASDAFIRRPGILTVSYRLTTLKALGQAERENALAATGLECCCL